MQSVGQAYAIIRGRRSGNVEKAKGFLGSMSAVKRKILNRQDAQARGSKRSKKPYKLGERVRTRRG